MPMKSCLAILLLKIRNYRDRNHTGAETMLTYQIYKNDELVKTIAAKGMNSIYTQYKKYCFTRHASIMMQCDQNTSVGLMYWTNYSENYYLKSAQNEGDLAA